LETKILRNLHRRIVKSFLDLIILAELRDGNPRSGYDVITLIHRKFHLLMSSGTVYSVLYSLERNGLVKGMWNQGKRVYLLTDKGEETLKAIQNARDTIQSLLKRILSSEQSTF